MDVGDHTAHHVDLRLLNPASCGPRSRGRAASSSMCVGHPVYFFAYPFGAYNDAVISELGSAGFTMAYTTAGGSTESSADPLTMPRIHVGRAETPDGVLGLVGGA